MAAAGVGWCLAAAAAGAAAAGPGAGAAPKAAAAGAERAAGCRARPRGAGAGRPPGLVPVGGGREPEPGRSCWCRSDGAAGGGVGRLLLIRRERAGRRRRPSARSGGVDAGCTRSGGGCRHRTRRSLLDRSAARGRAARYRGERSPRRRTPAPPSSESVPSAGPADFAALVALAAFFAGAGSSGWTGRRSPSASALRRTRSASASSMEDEWLLTPIPRERASSSPSLLVRPSSLASS